MLFWWSGKGNQVEIKWIRSLNMSSNTIDFLWHKHVWMFRDHTLRYQKTWCQPVAAYNWKSVATFVEYQLGIDTIAIGWSFHCIHWMQNSHVGKFHRWWATRQMNKRLRTWLSLVLPNLRYDGTEWNESETNQ